MFVSRTQYRVALICAILTLVTLALLYQRNPSLPLRLQLGKETSSPDSSKAWLYSEPEAEDKAVILAKIHRDDVGWVSENLRDWKQAIYYMDEPNEGNLHPPMNKGREAMAYLTFIIDHYDALPSYMVFVHPHLEGWPAAWHTDSDNYNQITSIRSLRLKYLDQHGYANMRCIHDPGCPAEIQVDRQEDHRTAEHGMREAWPALFGGNYTDIPKVIAQPCCSQFAISKSQALKRRKAEYEHYRKWLLDTPMDDETSGRLFEYLWQVIFGQEAVHCPEVQQCWCDQFGRC